MSMKHLYLIIGIISIGEEIYAWFGCVNSFKTLHYVVVFLRLKALEHFTFSGFSTNVVYAENQFVCVLLSCCYTCFVYASILCCKTFQVHMLWWRIIKVMFIVQEHTPYSNSWQVKIHDLCKVSCICSSYTFGFIRPNEILIMLEVMQRYECISLCISHHFERWIALKNNIFLLSLKNNRLFSWNNRLFYLWHIWIKMLWFLMHD